MGDEAGLVGVECDVEFQLNFGHEFQLESRGLATSPVHPAQVHEEAHRLAVDWRDEFQLNSGHEFQLESRGLAMPLMRAAGGRRARPGSSRLRG